MRHPVAPIALIFACVALPAMPAFAQSPAATYAPVATPTLDPDVLRTPDSAAAPAKKPALDTDAKASPPSLPNKVELGKYDLEFQAGKSSDVNPRTGYDSGETANIAKGKADPVLPDYFGLKLSTPTK